LLIFSGAGFSFSQVRRRKTELIVNNKAKNFMVVFLLNNNFLYIELYFF